jgi:hypothetical protein
MAANSDIVNLLHIIFCLHVERERLLAKVCECGVGRVINYNKKNMGTLHTAATEDI